MPVEELVARLAQDAQQHYYGKYRGIVVDNADPDKTGRLRLLVPSVLGDTTTNWAMPVLPFGGTADIGLFCLPEIDAAVWVEFEEGRLDLPLWTGTQWPAGQTSGDQAVGDPAKRVLQTKSMHRLELDDTEDAEQILLRHAGGALLKIDPNGTVLVEDGAGAALTMDADAGQVLLEDSNGNSILLSSQGVLVEDANGNKIELGATGLTLQGQMVKVSGQQVMLG
jgi:uncharacterized protein involved in type VI secretion and phage assembly